MNQPTYPFKRILVPTDFSLCAEIALQKALHMARQHQAEVHLLHVATSLSVDEQRMDARLAGAVKNSSQGPEGAGYPQMVQVRRAVKLHPDPVAAILNYVRGQAIDLVVMGTHGDHAADRFLSCGGGSLLGHTVEQVVRLAPCPVFTVGLCHPRDPEQVSRILVPVDRSALSTLALAYARDLAALYDAHLDVLHVIEVSSTTSPVEQKKLETVARAELAEAYKQAEGPEGPVTFHIARGHPDREVRRFARQEAVDLIVQEAHSNLDRAALGVRAEEVVRSALCPVLTVRSVEKEALPSLPAIDEDIDPSPQYVI